MKVMRIVNDVNYDVNNQITYKKEPAGRDKWQTPYETGLLRTGDCEDIALMKLSLLADRGVDGYLQRVQIGVQGHMVCVVPVTRKPWFKRGYVTDLMILDNREKYVYKKQDTMYSVNSFGYKLYLNQCMKRCNN